MGPRLSFGTEGTGLQPKSDKSDGPPPSERWPLGVSKRFNTILGDSLKSIQIQLGGILSQKHPPFFVRPMSCIYVFPCLVTTPCCRGTWHRSSGRGRKGSRDTTCWTYVGVLHSGESCWDCESWAWANFCSTSHWKRRGSEASVFADPCHLPCESSLVAKTSEDRLGDENVAKTEF